MGAKFSVVAGFCIALFTARKGSLGQGNVFTPVCHSVHRGRGVCPPPVPRCRPPWMQTPLGWVDPSLDADPPGVGQTPPPGLRKPPPPGVGQHPWMLIPPGLGSPLDADPSQCWADPPDADLPPSPDTVNKRAVRILLKCILVSLCLFIT